MNVRRTLWISGAALIALTLLVVVSCAVLRARRPKPAAAEDTTAVADAEVRVESAWKWGYGLMRDAAATSVEQRTREEFELLGVQRVPHMGAPPPAETAGGSGSRGSTHTMNCPGTVLPPECSRC